MVLLVAIRQKKSYFPLSWSYFFKPLKTQLSNFWISRFYNCLEFDMKDDNI